MVCNWKLRGQGVLVNRLLRRCCQNCLMYAEAFELVLMQYLVQISWNVAERTLSVNLKSVRERKCAKRVISVELRCSARLTAFRPDHQEHVDAVVSPATSVDRQNLAARISLTTPEGCELVSEWHRGKYLE